MPNRAGARRRPKEPADHLESCTGRADASLIRISFVNTIHARVKS